MPAKRKLIGLTGPSSFSQECMDAIEEYLDANFVLLYHGRDENVNDWLGQVDGVILAGGVDVHPSVYGESVWSNHNMSKFDIRRDGRELAVIDHCLDRGKPMLGICRGHQLLGIKHGLGFVMDISNSTVCHSPQRQQITHNPKEPMHSVKVINPDVVYGVYGMPQQPPERSVIRKTVAEKARDRIWVNSFHHQGVSYNPKRDKDGGKTDLARYSDVGVEVLGLSRVDLQCCKEIIELMQGTNGRWLSCQWHPEYDWRENSASRAILERYKQLLAAS